MANRAPKARLSGPSTAKVGDVVRFDGSLSSDDSGIKSGRLLWGDGDEVTFTDNRVGALEHVYTEAGTYDVTLEVVDTKGLIGAAVATLEVSEGGVVVPPVDPPVEPTAVDEVLGPWYLSSYDEWTECLPTGVQTRKEVWARDVVAPAQNGGKTSSQAERRETRFASQQCTYTPPMEPPVEPPVDPSVPSPDGARGVEIFDGKHHYSLGTDPGPYGAPFGFPVLVDGHDTGALGIEFYYKYGGVLFQNKSGYWYYVHGDSSVDQGAYAMLPVGELPVLSPPGEPLPGPNGPPPGPVDPGGVVETFPEPSPYPTGGDGTASLFNPTTDLVFEKFYDFNPLIGQYESIAQMSGFTGRMVNGEPRMLVSTSGSYDVFPTVYEFALTGLVAGGHINPLRVTNAWKGEDLFADMPFKPTAGVQGWDSLTVDKDGNLWHVGINFGGGGAPAPISRRKPGPNGSVTDFKWISLEGVNSVTVFGGVVDLPKWLQDKYGLGPRAAGFGGGLIQYATEQSLGLYAVAFPEIDKYANGETIKAVDLQKLADHTSGLPKVDRWHPPYSPSSPGPFDRGHRMRGKHSDFTCGGDAFEPKHGGAGWVDVVGDQLRASRTMTKGADPSQFMDALAFRPATRVDGTPCNMPSVVSSSGNIVQLGPDAESEDRYWGGSLSSFMMVYEGKGSWDSHQISGYDPAKKQLTLLTAPDPPLDPTSKIDIGGYADPPLFNLEPGQQFWINADFLQDGKVIHVHPRGYIVRRGVPAEEIWIKSRDAVHRMTLTSPLKGGDVEGAIILTPNIDPTREGITRDDRMNWTDPKDPTKGAYDGFDRFAFGDNYWSTRFLVDGPEKQGLLLLADVSRGGNFTSNFHVCSSQKAVELHVVDLHHLGEAAQGKRALYDVQPTHMIELEPVSSDIQAAHAAGRMPNYPPDPFVYARGTFPRVLTAHSSFGFMSIGKWFVAVPGVGNSGLRLYQYAVKAGAPKVPGESPDGTNVSRAENGALETPDASLVDNKTNLWELDTQIRKFGPWESFLGFDIVVNGVKPPTVRSQVGLNTIAHRITKVRGDAYTRDASGTWYGPNGPALDPTKQWEVAPTPSVGTRKLIGGWQVSKNLWGNLAMDFAGNEPTKAWLSGGYEGPHPISEFNLPKMSVGSDPTKWAMIEPSMIHDPWWAYGYCSGLVLWRGKLWMAPKVYYDTAPPLQTQLIAQDGETILIPETVLFEPDGRGGRRPINAVGRQAFAGFVKRGYGKDPYVGDGGDESGQGGACGPTLAKLNGTILISYGRPFELGPIDSENRPANWNQRAPRPPNYTMAWGSDGWVGFSPRVINGVLEGRWAAERIYGGGLELPEGVISYWPRVAWGNIDYGWQLPTFVPETHRRTYRYNYDSTTFALKNYELTGLGQVNGQELGPDGKVYLTYGPMDPLGGRGYTSLYIAAFA